MEHIKQQIEALRTQADLLANAFGAKKAHITVKLINSDNTQTFTEQEADAIDRIMAESGLFSERSCGDNYGNGVRSAMYHLKSNYAVYIMFYVKESVDTEESRLLKRLAEIRAAKEVSSHEYV